MPPFIPSHSWLFFFSPALSPYPFTSNLLLSRSVTQSFFFCFRSNTHIVSGLLAFQHLLRRSHSPLLLLVPPHLSLSLGGMEDWLVRTHSDFPSTCCASETAVCPLHSRQLCQGRSGVWVSVRIWCVYVATAWQYVAGLKSSRPWYSKPFLTRLKWQAVRLVVQCVWQLTVSARMFRVAAMFTVKRVFVMPANKSQILEYHQWFIKVHVHVCNFV